MGKTSIIKVLITESFEEEVQPVLPVVVVPREVTPERVHVSIVDTPSDSPFEGKLNKELTQADVVILVYDASDDSTRERIKSFWLPKFRQMRINVPIVLVANKIDKRPEVGNTAMDNLQAQIQPMMNEFKELDVCIECSAKNVMNIAEVFYYAQKAVLHPTFPLYDVDKHALKPDAALALRRIFRICDRDKDGVLNDTELNEFQQECFGVPLKDDELQGVKQVVGEKGPTGGISDSGGLTLEGFVFLHTLFVQKGRLETTWIVLRKFGYDDDLRLHLGKEGKIVLRPDQSCELSEDGIVFLGSLFDEIDEDKDGVISLNDFEKLLKRCPDNPFAPAEEDANVAGVSPPGEDPGTMTKSGFMAKFGKLAYDNPDAAILGITYLGYEGAPLSAIHVTKSRKRDRYTKTVSRNVFHALVVGDDSAGKTELVASFGGAKYNTISDVKAAVSCGMVPVDKEFGGGEKLLMLREVSKADTAKLLGSKEENNRFDLSCLVFDVTSMESLDYCKSLYNTMKEKKTFDIPAIFVACKMDLVEGATTNAVLTSADKFCESNGIPTPVRVSVKDEDTQNLYEDLVGVALNPQIACPDYYEGATQETSYLKTGAKVAVGAVALGVGLYGAKLLYDYYKRPTSASS